MNTEQIGHILRKEGYSEWCGLIREQIARLSPDITKLKEYKVNSTLRVYYHPKKKLKEIIKKYKEYEIEKTKSV